MDDKSSELDITLQKTSQEEPKEFIVTIKESSQEKEKSPPSILKYIFESKKIEVIILTLALFAAITSAYYAQQSVEVALQSSKNAVMPVLDISITDSGNQSFIKLKNHGGGVAILHGTVVKPVTNGEAIEWDQLNVDGVDFSKVSWSLVANYLIGLNGIEINKETVAINCADTYPLTPLGVKEEKILIKYNLNSNVINSNLDSQLKIMSCYCSIYEQCWETEFKKGFREVDNCSSYKPEKLVSCS